MRRIVLAVLAVAAFAAPAAAARGELTQQSQRDFDAGGLRTLRVENARGLVEVKRSGDGRIHLYALKRIRAAGSQRERLARETLVDTDRSGDTFSIRVRYAQGPALHISFLELLAGFDTPLVEVQLSVEVPPAMAVDVRSASGDVRTAGLAGPEHLVTTSGHVRIEGAAGPVVVAATSGSISASGLAGASLRSVSGDIGVDRVARGLTAATTSGGITVKGAADSLDLATVSGDVEVDASPRRLAISTGSGGVDAKGIAGTVSASSTSGDIELHAVSGFARAEATTVSGDVTLALPRGFGGNLEMTTTSGALDVALPMELRAVSRHQLRGRIGQGAGRIELKSTSGDLHITGGGNGS